MPDSIPFSKLKILLVNIIGILYKATALNVHRFHADMHEVKVLLKAHKQELWICELMIFLISAQILMRFLFCFLGLVANIVAIYPILTNSQPELLMPTIILQVFDNVVLNIYELMLGYGCLKYLHPESYAVFFIFLTKLIIKTSLSVSALNIYSDKHHELATRLEYNRHDDNLDRESSVEILLAHQRYSRILNE